MSDPIQTVCLLTGCTEEEADRALMETEDIVDAVDRLLEKKPSPADKYINSKKRAREVTPEEEIVQPIRAMMKKFDEVRPISLYQREPEVLDEMQDLPEETVQQNNYSQECQLPSLESKAQKQETAYQLPSEYSCDSQSNDQTSLCSDLQSLQLSQVQEKESSQMVERIPV